MNPQTENNDNSHYQGVSIRDYDEKVSDLDNWEKRSKVSKLPKKACSWEGKENAITRRRSTNSHQSSTTSMIPRPERKKFSKRLNSPARSHKEFKTVQKEKTKKHPQSANSSKDGRNVIENNNKTKESTSQTVLKVNPLEIKLDEDFAQFKQNIMKIPQFWSDADQTVKNILKNAVSIVTKQYPTADVEAFELEIQNILKATELVKKEILMKTEDIVNQANKIYRDGYEGTGPTDEELKLIAKKMEELKNNVNAENNAFGDLLKYGSPETLLKCHEKDIVEETVKANKNEESSERKLDHHKSRKKMGKTKLRMGDGCENIQAHGDNFRQDVKAVCNALSHSENKTFADQKFQNKSCQTMSLWATEMIKREESLKVLNDQVLELQHLCKDHITKFKSFNFQIKLRGMCNKTAQNMFPARDVTPAPKNKLSLCGKDYEYTTAKSRDVDVHQKNRLLNQQKKLLHVRDELIEMLKNRCNVEVEEI